MTKPKHLKGAKTSLLVAGLAVASGVFDELPSVPQKKNNKLPFSEDELEKLASLSGKEKKRYVKELKAKYSGGSNA